MPGVDVQVKFGWSWRKLYLPPAKCQERNIVVHVERLKLCPEHGDFDPTTLRRNPVVFITGDGQSLQQDVKEFESWGIPHDLYAVNRSLIFHERQVDHWGAIDLEESVWFAENVNSKIQNGRKIIRHTIGYSELAYDIGWQMDYPFENDFQRRVWAGNSGYFAILTALHMGYERIIIGGMGLKREPHWYEPATADGPNWAGIVYTQWMDFKMLVPEADKCRSLSGYSAFILGKATKEWVT
jgi:hypothetical protein